MNHRNIVPHNEYNNIYAPKTFVYNPRSTSQIFTPNNNGLVSNDMIKNGIYSSISWKLFKKILYLKFYF